MTPNRTMTWVIRMVGAMTTIGGVSTLIAGRTAPDPTHPASSALVVVAGSLLLWVGYARGGPSADPEGGSRG